MRVWNETGWDSKRLKSLMDSAGLTTTGMADRLHVSEQTIKNWLADMHRISRIHCRNLERMERRIAAREAASV